MNTAPWFDELVKIVSKAAPTLGTVLGGPMGGIAASLLQSEFNGASLNDTLKNIASDPAATEKIKQLESDHQEALEKLVLQDVESARAMPSTDSIRKLLILSLILMIIMTSIGAYLGNDTTKHFLLPALGVMLAELRQVMRLYFGGLE